MRQLWNLILLKSSLDTVINTIFFNNGPFPGSFRIQYSFLMNTYKVWMIGNMKKMWKRNDSFYQFVHRKKPSTQDAEVCARPPTAEKNFTLSWSQPIRDPVIVSWLILLGKFQHRVKFWSNFLVDRLQDLKFTFSSNRSQKRKKSVQRFLQWVNFGSCFW